MDRIFEIRKPAARTIRQHQFGFWVPEPGAAGEFASQLRNRLMRIAMSGALLGLSAAAAPGQVSLVSFDWSSMGGAAASATGVCSGEDCVPQYICQSGFGDSYTIGGSTFELLSTSAAADRSCAAGCVNQGAGGNAAAQASVLVNINDPFEGGGVTRWAFSHHMGTSAGTGCFDQGCGICEHAGADGSATQVWNLVFDLHGPMTVRLDYSQTVQRGGPIGGATSTFTLASLTQTYFTETITVDTDPSVQTSGNLEWVLPAGQYRLDVDASCTASPASGNGQSQDGTTVTFANSTLTILSCAPGCCPCIGDFDASNNVTPVDVPGFVAALLAGGACPVGNCCTGDLNADGFVDGNDVPEFVVKLLAGWICQ